MGFLLWNVYTYMENVFNLPIYVRACHVENQSKLYQYFRDKISAQQVLVAFLLNTILIF